MTELASLITRIVSTLHELENVVDLEVCYSVINEDENGYDYVLDDWEVSYYTLHNLIKDVLLVPMKSLGYISYVVDDFIECASIDYKNSLNLVVAHVLNSMSPKLIEDVERIRSLKGKYKHVLRFIRQHDATYFENNCEISRSHAKRFIKFFQTEGYSIPTLKELDSIEFSDSDDEDDSCTDVDDEDDDDDEDDEDDGGKIGDIDVKDASDADESTETDDNEDGDDDYLDDDDLDDDKENNREAVPRKKKNI
jgi:hypothetical protein